MRDYQIEFGYSKWMMRSPLFVGAIFSHTWTLGGSVQELFDRIPKEGHFELTVLPHGESVEVIP